MTRRQPRRPGGRRSLYKDTLARRGLLIYSLSRAIYTVRRRRLFSDSARRCIDVVSALLYFHSATCELFLFHLSMLVWHGLKGMRGRKPAGGFCRWGACARSFVICGRVCFSFRVPIDCFDFCLK